MVFFMRHIDSSGDSTYTNPDWGWAAIYQFHPDNGQDVVTNFVDGRDSIDLRYFSSIASFDDLTVTQDGDDVVIDLSAHGGGSITLQGIGLADIDSSDFVFFAHKTVTGDDGNNDLAGDTGDDTVYGGDGDDMIHGEEGETLSTAAPATTFFTAETETTRLRAARARTG